MKVRRYPSQTEWNCGIAVGSDYVRVGFARSVWLIEGVGWRLRAPCFTRADAQVPAQLLLPIPFAREKPWLLVTFTRTPSIVRL